MKTMFVVRVQLLLHLVNINTSKSRRTTASRQKVQEPLGVLGIKYPRN